MNNKQMLLKELLNIVNVDFTNVEDLLNVNIEREILVDKKAIAKMHEMIPKLKNEYHSDMFSCLHDNSLQKQRFPGVCMVRQMLKANDLALRPRVVSAGYEKKTGKKIMKRSYIIKRLDDEEIKNKIISQDEPSVTLPTEEEKKDEQEP